MWSPSSSEPTPPESTFVDDPALREFARDEGVPLELIQGAMSERAELSIVVAFLRSTPDTRPRIADRFELLEVIGEGSYGQVYRARDHVLARDVAIKVMRLGDPETADREARALAALVHPNVVRIYDQGRCDDFRWIEMEWLDGPTLFEWCADKSPAEILARYIEAGRGLAATHECGLVHRDFKANNVMLDREGKAMLVDFGLARTLESLREQPYADRIVGALPYLAPERLSGEQGDARSDQFAFCAALWEALTGSNPFFVGALDIDERLAAMRLPPHDRRRVPRRVRAALERGLSLEPAGRWPSMEFLLEQLEPPTPFRWGAAALLFSACLMAVAVVVGMGAPSPPELPSFSDEPPPHAQHALDAVAALDKQDYEAAAEALHQGYPLACQAGAESEFVGVAFAVASAMDDAKLGPAAVEAWLLVARLHDRMGDETSKQAAIDKANALMNPPRQGTSIPSKQVTVPSSLQTPSSHHNSVP